MSAVGQHNVRVDDDLWRAAMQRAKSEGITVTDVITRALSEYAAPGPASPPPPDVVKDAIVTIEDSRQSHVAVGSGRCNHPGVRIIGGWCKECEQHVHPGGRWAS